MIHVSCYYSTHVMLAVLGTRSCRLLARVNCHVLLLKLESAEIILRLRICLMIVHGDKAT